MAGYASPRALEMAVKEAAKRSPMDTNRAIARFYFHRLLCRVFSDPASPFVLKGGLGVLACTTDARYTRDIDLTTNSLDIDAAVNELKTLALKNLDDFVSFRYVGCNPIKAEDEYREGRTVTFDVFLGAKRIQTVSVDLVADEINCGEPDRISPSDRIELAGIGSCDYLVYPDSCPSEGMGRRVEFAVVSGVLGSFTLSGLETIPSASNASSLDSREGSHIPEVASVDATAPHSVR